MRGLRTLFILRKKSMDMEAVHTVNDYAKQLYKKI